jgi:PAS domain-containing protein
MVDDDRTSGPHPVELILAKQWAGLLSVPVFLLDASGHLVFYNGDAASLLGKSPRDEDGLSRTEWVHDLPMRDEDGTVQDHLESPLTAVLASGRVEQRDCWILDRKQVLRPIQVTAFPIRGLAGTFLGVMALFFVRD